LKNLVTEVAIQPVKHFYTAITSGGAQGVDAWRNNSGMVLMVYKSGTYGTLTHAEHLRHTYLLSISRKKESMAATVPTNKRSKSTCKHTDDVYL
jgi:ketosteroid isomerase-like protein